MTWIRTQWDRAGGGAAVGLGAVLLLLGWRGVADSALTAEQIPYVVSGGLGGLFLLAVGATLWISADLRDEWRKLDALHDELQRQGRSVEPAPAEGPAEDPRDPVIAGAGNGAAVNGNGRPARRPLRAR